MSDTPKSAAGEAIAEPGLPVDGGIWDSVLEGLRGSQRDFTQGSVPRAILVLAIPMVLEMVMESIFAVCDVFFVAKLGASAVTTVGLTESFLTLIYAIAMGLAIAASATVARRTGERDADGAAHVAAQSLLLGVGISLVIGVLGVLFAPKLLSLMGAEPDVLAIGTSYTRVMLGGCVTIVMLFLINSIFRGVGDAVIAMRVLWLANGINIVLGPCLIFGVGPFPKLGVVGAAIATNIGRGTGALFALSRLLRPGSRLDLHARHLRFDREVIVRLARMSQSATVQLLIGMGSWIALVRVLSTFGSNALAGYTIAIRVIMFALLPASGLANAAATMVGQALGARKPERAEQAVRLAGMYNTAVLTVVGGLLAVFAHGITNVFTHDPAIIPYATDALRIVACGFPFYAWGMVLEQAFNGAGDTRTPTLLNLFVFWLWEVPLAWLLGIALHLGPRGIYIAMMIAFSTLAVASGVLFKKGNWKKKDI